MCGILFRIGTGTVVHPICCGVHECSAQWESSDIEEIKNLINQDLSSTLELRPNDIKKIGNLKEIRELNEKLNRVKNTIGKSPDHSEQLKEEKSRLQSQIDDLSVDDAQDLMEDKLVLDDERDFDTLISSIAGRGPDYLQYLSYPLTDGYHIQQFSAILSLRQPFVKQPIHVRDIDIVIQFNGELYNKECIDSNDTKFITERVLSNINNGKSRHNSILQTISELEGEFAYVILDKSSNLVYFGRDFIGKRSLVYKLLKNEEGKISEFITSSIAIPTITGESEYIECKSEEINILNIKSGSIETVEISRPKPSPEVSLEVLGLKSGHKVDELINEFDVVFTRATKDRIDTIHPLHDTIDHASLGILFSGGLDCTVVAGAIGRIYNERKSTNGMKILVDLLTVGFENPRTQASAQDSPDRQLAKKSWFELAKKFNSDVIDFRLVEVDVGYEEWLRHRHRVKRLMYPCDTEMDLSIAIAFYFASRGEFGTKLSLDFESQTVVESNYTSRAKVLLSGLGADELFAGYSRHELAFDPLMPPQEGNEEEYRNTLMQCYMKLKSELTIDIKNIYKRNLGRDDRVISSWGKELRYPFLEEDVINFVMSKVPLDLKLEFQWETVTNRKGKTLTRIKPIRKWLLREYAEYLGLSWVKHELKRAIQFGAKSAKMEIGQNKTRGTDTLK